MPNREELLQRICHTGTGTQVVNCVIHMHRGLTDRPAECHLCAVDTQNRLRLAITVNEWLNTWKEDATALLSEPELEAAPTRSFGQAFGDRDAFTPPEVITVNKIKYRREHVR